MIDAGGFLEAAAARGFDFYTGVPCSFLTPLINRTINHAATRYVGAASEGEAVAMAAGAWLAGRGTVVMCQNSGLGNCVNPLTSLNFPFRIPTLLVTTWRGQPGLADEPQHQRMGEITQALLDTIGIGWRPFPVDAAEVAPALDAAVAAMDDSGLPFALVMAKGSVAHEALDQAPGAPAAAGSEARRLGGGPPPTRFAVLERFLAAAPDAAAVVATTGKCGRELFTIADRAQHLYQVGSMGCASAMGLGVALNVDRPVAVLDGDGAALMKLGSFATIGAAAPANLVHVVLDNGVHDSTGGQAIANTRVDFAAVALACGYRRAVVCDAVDAFGSACAEAFAAPGPHLVHVRVAPGSIDGLGRPDIGPADVARRFRAFLAGV